MVEYLFYMQGVNGSSPLSAKFPGDKMKAKILLREKAIELRKEGLSVPNIAKELGISKSSAFTWTREAPIPKGLSREDRRQRKIDRLKKLKEESDKKKADFDKIRKQKKTPAQAPFEDYWLYGPVFHKNEGRYYAHLKHRTIVNKWKLRLYSRYLMCVHLGRELSTSEEVDHIDKNKLNDNIENLQILDKRSHRKKDRRGITMVSLECAECLKPFKRMKRKVFKGSLNKHFCSPSCRSKHVRRLQVKGDL